MVCHKTSLRYQPPEQGNNASPWSAIWGHRSNIRNKRLLLHRITSVCYYTSSQYNNTNQKYRGMFQIRHHKLPTQHKDISERGKVMWIITQTTLLSTQFLTSLSQAKVAIFPSEEISQRSDKDNAKTYLNSFQLLQTN